MNGVSLSASFGRWAGFTWDCNRDHWRIVVGWVALAIYWFDMDLALGELLRKLEERQGSLKR